ncbi:MAG: fumarate reductase/succinate dehydrogenase flavoprotein domain protein [Chloroflexi bacterium]|nr:fumarate reductase/succinate dehydrogenase flavoprotein domain protein [Chloroflexota bacterium]
MNETSPSPDLIVVGSGLAGLATALAAGDAGARVRLLTAGDLLSGSSPWAQGGIAAALGADDHPSLHAADTLAVGGGLNDAAAVDVLVHSGRAAVLDLLESGVPFDSKSGRPELGLEAGHQRRRIVHAEGTATGHVITKALLARTVRHPRIHVSEHTPAQALLREGHRIVGVRSGSAIYQGNAVVLATGGYAALWGRTTNTPASRGAGLALAWGAGATLADLEFVQFHPTALALPGRPAFLLSEALRGEGALLLDADDRQIVDPLLPRDVVARAVARHWQERGPVYLSMRHLPASVRARFAPLAAQLLEWGLDLARDRVPVAPAAHYCMGGVRSDDAGRTDVAGLYVAGEVACTGVQGANRLASNSLLECLVFGQRAAAAALADSPDARAAWSTTALPAAPDIPEGKPEPDGSRPREADDPVLDRDLGTERSKRHLQALVRALPRPDDTEPCDPRLVPHLATRSALVRAESRGAHYRTDAPQALPEWQGHILWRRGMEPQFERIVT